MQESIGEEGGGVTKAASMSLSENKPVEGEEEERQAMVEGDFESCPSPPCRLPPSKEEEGETDNNVENKPPPPQPRPLRTWRPELELPSAAIEEEEDSETKVDEEKKTRGEEVLRPQQQEQSKVPSIKVTDEDERNLAGEGASVGK